jgi:hypothetical protein
LANDWQAFHASPFRETIKLEADMVITGDISHWWSWFEHRDVVVSQGIRNYLNQVSGCRAYRRLFDDNDLPDVYNAITYWRLSNTARDFFQHVRTIFEHWNDYKKLLKFADDMPSTDVVYAMAAQIMGPDRVTLPAGLGPTMIHMKRHINGLHSEDWTRELIWEKDPFRINTIAQWGFVHYHQKEWTLE